MNWQIAPEFRGTLIRQIAATAALTLFILFTFRSASLAASADSDLKAWQGSNLPSFVLPTTTGSDVGLETERGHVVLVHFFATWCEPCREELPALNRLSARATDTVKVVAISVAEVDIRVQRFLETTPVGFPVLLDRERAVAREWGVSTLPTTFILGADLQPRFFVEADFAWDRIDSSALIAMLAKNAGEIRPAKSVRRSTMEE